MGQKWIKQLMAVVFVLGIFFLVEGWIQPAYGISMDFTFEKVNEEGDNLQGAEFRLSGNGVTPSTNTSDANGRVTFPGLFPGTYSLEELTAPIGYTTSPGALTLELRENGPAPAFYINGVIAQGYRFVNKRTESIFTLILQKYDKDDDSILLSGAEFALYRENQAAGVDTKIGEYTTDANGQIRVDVNEEGSYYFVELSPPGGYRISGDNKTSSRYVGPNGTTGNFAAFNEKIPPSSGGSSGGSQSTDRPDKTEDPKPVPTTTQPQEPIQTPVQPQELIQTPEPMIDQLITPEVEPVVAEIQELSDTKKKTQPTLPKTGGVAPTLLVGLGILASGTGCVLKRKK